MTRDTEKAPSAPIQAAASDAVWDAIRNMSAADIHVLMHGDAEQIDDLADRTAAAAFAKMSQRA